MQIKIVSGGITEKVINSKNMAVCSRSVWLGNVVGNYFKLAGILLSAGSGSYQSGTDGIYSAGTGSLWNLYHYRGITAFGRIFDAFTDPMIASLSDRCTSKHGRRIPFLKWASLPLALSTVLVFWSPVNKNSRINAVFLLVMILAYYLSITAYCTPYNALIPELGHTQQERLNISTVISFTFIAEQQLRIWHRPSGACLFRHLEESVQSV